MRILVFNAGSSSLKFGVFDIAGTERHVLKGGFERFEQGRCRLAVVCGDQRVEREAALADIAAAANAVPNVLEAFGQTALDAVGHRIAHGGPDFAEPARLDDAAVAAIEGVTPLAPLHNPANLKAVALARRLWPDLPQVAVFDTAFHQTNPPAATTYAVPREWRDAGLRRYGFHGTSHKYVAQRAAQALDRPLETLKIVSCHLGNGASACAIDRGRSVDSSMGVTPLEGLVMGTRSGDMDPGAFGFLHRQLGLGIEEIEDALYRRSGLLALCGAADMRDIERRAAEGDDQARLAIEIYAYRVRKYVGAYAAAMGGIDALVFTGGIGENSPAMRARICGDLDFLGLGLDPERNRAVKLEDRAAPRIEREGSRAAVIVTETAEQLMIARETAQLLSHRA
ncbi:acetate kinase [Glycocaulis profundi]|nr:acetate kinase [Glycocaulis profundi]